MTTDTQDARARRHKDQGSILLAKGKTEPALLEFQRAVELQSTDVVARRKVAELLAKLGRNKEAVKEYQHLAGRFAAEGRLLEAIAMSKVILQLDPSHLETQETLAKLYARRSSSPGIQKMPPSMSAAIESSSGRAVRMLPKPRLGLPADNNNSPGISLSPDDGTDGSADIDYSMSAADFAASLESRDSSAGVDARHEQDSVPLPAPVRTPSQAGIKAPPAANKSSGGVPRPVSTSGLQPVRPASSPGLSVPSRPPSSAGEVEIELAELPTTPLFSELPADLMQVLLERLTMLPFAAGQTIIAEGEMGKALFVLASGLVEVVRVDPKGNRVVIDRMKEGAFFGEIGLVAEVPRLASVVAVEDSVVLGVTRELIDELSKDFPFLQGLVKSFYKARLLNNVMRASPIFTPLTPDERKALVEKFTLVRAAAGEDLLKQGEPGKGLYLLLRGRCSVTFRDVAGVDHPLPELREGAVMGEISLITGGTATATVTAKTAAVLFRLDPGPFVEHLLSNPMARALMLKLSEERMQRTDALEFSSLDPSLL